MTTTLTIEYEKMCYIGNSVYKIALLFFCLPPVDICMENFAAMLKFPFLQQVEKIKVHGLILPPLSR